MSLSSENIGKVCIVHCSTDDNINDKIGTIVGYYKDISTNDEYELVSAPPLGECMKIYNEHKRTLLADQTVSKYGATVWHGV